MNNTTKLHYYTIISFFTTITLFPIFAIASDLITIDKPLNFDQTIVSAGGRFELGFFNSSNTNWYIGICYKKVHVRTIVWVANRDNPLTSMPGVLKIGQCGNIFIIDNSSNTIWASGQFTKVHTFAQLLDSGNFVIRLEDDLDPENYIWQSFNYPTQTLLPHLEEGGNVGSQNAPKRGKKVVIIVAITGGIGIMLFAGLIICVVWIRKTPQIGQNDQIAHRGPFERSYYFKLKGVQNNRDHTSNDYLVELPLFEFHTIVKATNSFSEGNKVGQGGFGSVYKGVLVEGQEVAVKRLAKNSGQGMEEFKNEVTLISKLQHRNLVRLLGCCVDMDEKMLIYEFLENGSLDSMLFKKDRSSNLNWDMRFKIICGIARGLLYLHQDSRFRIIHRDFKAGNILLDKYMNPKISDFGMARIFGRHQINANTKRIVGTYGYMSPEYAMSGIFSVKSDVFSFGVLLLEIVSGQKNKGCYQPIHRLNIIGNVSKSMTIYLHYTSFLEFLIGKIF